MSVKGKRWTQIISFVLAIIMLVESAPVSALDSISKELQLTENEIITEEAYVIEEAVEKREENVKHFRMSDGSFVAAVYPQPVHYKDGNEYKELDNTFITDKEGNYVTKDNPLEMTFAKNKTEDTFVTLEKDDYILSWGLVRESKLTSKDFVNRAAQMVETKVETNLDENSKAMQAEKVTSGLKYQSVQQDMSLEYFAIGQSVKENIILHSKNAENEYTFLFQAEGLSARLTDLGEVEFFDAESEEVVYVIPAGYMEDAAGAYSDEVNYELASSSEGYLLKVTADKEWLQEATRKYPVTVDPTVIINGNNKISDTYVDMSRSANYYQTNPLRVYNEGGNKQRISYVKLNQLPSINETDVIVNGTLNFVATNKNSRITSLAIRGVTSDWNQQTIGLRGVSLPSIGDSVIDQIVLDSSGGEREISFNITRALKEWYQDPNSNYGLQIQTNTAIGKVDLSSSESTNAPFFTIQYQDTTGLESYYPYHTHSVGRSGTGHINDFTGELTYVYEEDTTVSGNRMPASIQRVYNSRSYQDCDWCNFYPYLWDCSCHLHDQFSGWNLNFHQSVQVVNYDSYDITKHVYKYIDGDGTEHYFYYDDEENAFLDRDNLGLKLTNSYFVPEDPSMPPMGPYAWWNHECYIITDSAENIYRFGDPFSQLNCNVFEYPFYTALNKITDSSGNELEITYNPSYLANGTTGYVSQITDGVGNVYRFGEETDGDSIEAEYIDSTAATTTYESAMISGKSLVELITRDDDTSTIFGYDNTGRLTSVTDKDALGNTNYQVVYTYDAKGRVASVTEKGSDGSTGNSFAIVYDHLKTTFTDNHNRSVTELFDTYGNVICAYDDTGDIVTNNYGRTDGFKHNLLSSGATNINDPQLLTNPSFTSSSSWSVKNGMISGTDYSFESTGTNSLDSLGAVKLLGSATAEKTVSQTVQTSGQIGDSFIFGGWAKGNATPAKEDERNFGVSLQFNYTDNTTSDEYVRFNDSVWDEYLFTSSSAVAEKPYSSMTFTIHYSNSMNSVYFDKMFLKKDIVQFYDYDVNGNLISEGTQGERTDYEYDANRLVGITAPNGVQLTYTYDQDGNVESEESTEHIKTDYTYDSYGNTTSSSTYSTADANFPKIETSSTYTNNGNYLASETDERGNTTLYNGYDRYGNLVSVTDAKGNTVTSSYAGKQLSGLSGSYKQYGDSISNSVNVSYGYNGAGGLSSITSPSGVFGFLYNAFGNLSCIKVGTNRTLISHNYAASNGNLLSSTYGNGVTVNYEYDGFDRVTGMWFGNNTAQKTIYTYNTGGDLIEVTDGITGDTTTYTYNGDGTLYSVETDDLTANYFYDGLGRNRLTQNTFGNTTYSTEYIYGSVDPMKDYVTGLKINNASVLSYSYDVLQRLTQKNLIGANNFATNYAYLQGTDATITTNLLASVQNGNNTLGYSYDELGNITEIKKNNVLQQSYEYNELGWMIRENDVTLNKTIVYFYDTSGNITTRKEYAYTTGAISGNPTTKNYTYGDAEWKDLLTNYNGSTITYDAIGNPLQYRDGMNFSWSNGRWLTEIGNNISYTYNSDGIRVSKTVNSVETSYVLDGTKIMTQTTGNDTSYFLYDDDDSLLGLDYNNNRYYYLYNAQNDIIGVVDTSGNIVVEYAYDAWGNVLSVTGTLAATLGQDNPFRYRSYYYDTETGFYYLQSRYYDPVAGRLINADQLVDNGYGLLGTNMFAYCLSSPVNMTDKEGEAPSYIINTQSNYTTVYINGRRKYMKDVRWGPFGNLSANGCGVIAAYNVLRSFSAKVTFSSVYGSLTMYNAALMFGVWGVNPVSLAQYMAGKFRTIYKVPYFSSSLWTTYAGKSDAVIILFVNPGGKGMHYVAGIRTRSNFRFYNSKYYGDQYISISNYVKNLQAKGYTMVYFFGFSGKRGSW